MYPPRAFHPSEVEFSLKKISPKKSPGFDLISSKVIKYLLRIIIIFLTQIYNKLLEKLLLKRILPIVGEAKT